MSMTGDSSVAARAPMAPQDLRYRLVALKEKSKRGVDSSAWASCLPVFFLIWGVIHNINMFMTLPLAGISPAGGGSYMLFGMFGSFVGSILATVGAVLLIKNLGRKAFTRWHAQVWSELHCTSLAVLAVDETYTRLLTERIEDTWALRWMAPPPPRTLEQQLEFAASYHIALRKLLWGVGRLENMPLWQGGFAWSAGTSRGLTCGCAAYLFLSVIGAALWVLGILFYLQRCAALAAFCDFLLYDDRRTV